MWKVQQTILRFTHQNFRQHDHQADKCGENEQGYCQANQSRHGGVPRLGSRTRRLPVRIVAESTEDEIDDWIHKPGQDFKEPNRSGLPSSIKAKRHVGVISTDARTTADSTIEPPRKRPAAEWHWRKG